MTSASAPTPAAPIARAATPATRIQAVRFFMLCAPGVNPGGRTGGFPPLQGFAPRPPRCDPEGSALAHRSHLGPLSVRGVLQVVHTLLRLRRELAGREFLRQAPVR